MYKAIKIVSNIICKYLKKKLPLFTFATMLSGLLCNTKLLFKIKFILWFLIKVIDSEINSLVYNEKMLEFKVFYI